MLPIIVWSIFQMLPTLQIWAIGLIAGLFIPALILRSTVALHITIFCLLSVFLPLAVPFFGYWPFRLLAPLLGYHLIVLSVPPLRRSYMAVRLGRISKDVFVLMAAAVLVSTVALIGWCMLMRPDLSLYFGQIPNMPLAVIPFAGLGFAIVNAVMEEFAFRGIILHAATSAVASAPVAIAIQAVAFGLFHYIGGFPNGIAGVLMTLIYGLLLGIVRVGSKGMMAPIVTHMFADLVIFSLLITFLRMAATS